MTVLRLGHSGLSFHAATAAAVARVIEAHDCEAEIVVAPRAALFAELAEGNIDLLAAAWLPQEAERIAGTGIGLLGLLYRPLVFWGVPAHVPEAELASLEDLLKPEVREKLSGRILPAGTDTPARAEAVMASYGLAEAGYGVQAGSLDEAVAAYRTAEDAGQWAVLPLWAPHYLNQGATPIRPLADPRGALGGEQEARLLMRAGLAGDIDPDLLDELGELPLSNRIIGAMDQMMVTEGASAEDAAEAWQRGRLSSRL